MTACRPGSCTCPWTSWREWDVVFDQLYSQDTDDRRKGLARVAAWKARGSVPALLEVTADLVSCFVHEQECEQNSPVSSEHVLQLMYAMALTRFVNGVFDVNYVRISGPTRDIKTVLGHFGVPSYIVSLRHDCAHRTLPSLESLKCGTDWGLQWLLSNYWEPQRLINQHSVENSGTDADEFVSLGKRKRKRRTKTVLGTDQGELNSFLSSCSVLELSEQLLCGQILKNPAFLAEESDQTVLPRAKIEGGSWTQLMQSVRSRAGSRPGLETLVICAFITATHDPSCDMNRKQFLAACLDHLLVLPTGNTGLNHEAINWTEVFLTILDKPGVYSEAILNIVLPRVRQHLPAGVAASCEQLTSLIALSEGLSHSAYNRPITAAAGKKSSADVVSREVMAKSSRDGDCAVMEEMPSSKQCRQDTCKHSLVTVTGSSTSDKRTFSKRDVAKIQTDIYRYFKQESLLS